MMVPPLRLMAPATPAPIKSWLFAALTMASTSYSVMSPRSRLTSVWPTLTFIPPLLGPPGLMCGSARPDRRAVPRRRNGETADRPRGSAALLGFGLHPQPLHLVEGQRAELAPTFLRRAFHVLKSRGKALDGALQGGFGIDLGEPGHVDGGEEEITRLGLNGCVVTARQRRRELRDLLSNLVQSRHRVRPVEAHAGGAMLDPLGPQQAGQ